VEKLPRLNWATQFMTVTDDGACSIPFLSEWRFLRRLALQEKKKNLDDSSRLHVVEIARVA